MHHWVDSADELYDFISLVVAYAPDDFPQEDYLEDDEQLNLSKAFDEIYRGLGFLAQTISVDMKDRLLEILDSALKAYENGDDVQGAHLLQDFRRLGFGRD